MNESLLARITLNPKVCKGKQTIRNMRFTVAKILELMAEGMDTKEILADYPYIEKEDIWACLWYVSRIASI